MASSSSAAESTQAHGLKNRLAWWGGAALMLLVSWYVGEIQRQALLDLPADDLFVAADKVQLEQVLVNLIGNACDVLRDRPRRQIRVDAHREGAEVRLNVHDSGPGIAEKNLDKIFDPFFTTSEAGLGLGSPSHIPSHKGWVGH